MRVLVSGANGFIGKYVLAALRVAGHEAIGLDKEWLNLRWYESVDLAVDITKPIPQMQGLDAVIHLAAMSNPRECDANPSMAYDVNVNGTNQVLRMARESGVKRFLFASTAHVYDIPPKYLPTDEVHPLRLNNTYTTTKILGEQLCQLYYENHGLSYAILRLFNAYGPEQAKGYFIPDQLSKASKGEISLRGANTTKDWVWVGDVADAFVRALSTEFVGPVNIGTGIETDLATIARIIAEGFGAKFAATPSDNATRMCADIGRAKRILGWQPTVSLEEGINACLDAAKAPRPLLA